jgi:hypothetical protein
MKWFLLITLVASAAFAADETYIGWVSDSQCAFGRSSVGTFTATNPDCARRCIKEGKQIVLISAAHKTVFAIQNPEALKAEVGNKVSVLASSAGKNLLHVSKVTSSEQSNPECERPRLKE